MEEFTQFFNENLDGDEEGVYYERWVKNDLDAITLAFSSGVKGYRIFREEEVLFQIKGQILDDGFDRYTANGRHSFDRRYGELGYSPSAAAEEFFSEEHGILANQVDPENATEMEMFVLCNDMDANGQGTGGRFGIWQTLNYFRQSAVYHGYFELPDQTGSYHALRQNWLAMVIRMNADYEKAGLERQAADGRMLVQILRGECGSSAGDGKLISPGDNGMAADSEGGVTAAAMVEDGMLLTNEISRCSYPSEGGTGEEIHYIVCYTRDGILCKRAGGSRVLWKMLYRNERDYGRVMGFLRNFGSGENLRFAAHKGFWQDYLSGDMDVEGFLDFFARAENGIPNYLFITDYGAYVDREGLKYQKYFAWHSIAEPRPRLPDTGGDLSGNSGEHLQWQENYQRWKREFVSLFEETGKRQGYYSQ